MNLLLDTHVFIWCVGEPAKLSKHVAALLTRDDVTVTVSAVSGWEIATKVRLGKLVFPFSVIDDFSAALHGMAFKPLGISFEAAVAGARLAGDHRDPFDRMLAGQAIVEKLDLVSADPAFKVLGVATIW